MKVERASEDVGNRSRHDRRQLLGAPPERRGGFAAVGICFVDADHYDLFAYLEVGRYPPRAIEIARYILPSRSFFGMGNVVFPLRLVVVDAVLDSHLERAIIRSEDEARSRFARLLGEELVEPGIRLRGGMEAPPLDVGAEDYPHLVANVVVAALVARDDEPRGVPALCKRKHK